MSEHDQLSLYPPPSHPPTAATSVQTFVPMDDEKDAAGSAPSESQPQAPSSTPATMPSPALGQPPTPIPQTPQTALTFLLVSGRRRTMSFDPETTVGRVKELVWNAWPSEWQDVQPPAPSYLRILYLGKILQDEDTLSKLSFPTHIPQSQAPAPTPSPTPTPTPTPTPPPTIVHLSIRPYAPAPLDDPQLKKKSRRARAAAASNPTDAALTGAGGPDAGEALREDGAGGCCGCIIC